MNQNLIGNSIAQVMPTAISTGLAISTITIQEPSGTIDAAGAPDGLYVDVAGLVSLKCMMSAEFTQERMAADELKALAEVAEMQIKHVWMTGWFPQIVSHWRAVVDGLGHDILGVEWDSQKQMTRLKVQVLNV